MRLFSVKGLGSMLNNIHFAALHVLMWTMSSFLISSQGCLVKSDAFDWFFWLNLQRPMSAINTAWFKHLKRVNS